MFYKNDVRQKVVASGTFDIKGSVYAAHNLEVPSQAPKEDINGSSSAGAGTICASGLAT